MIASAESEVTQSDLETLKSTRKTTVRLLTAIAYYQDRIRKFVKDKYEHFIASDDYAQTFLPDGEKLWKETEELLATAGQETYDIEVQVACELVAYLRSLKETNIGLRVSLRILHVDILLQKIDDAHSAHNYETGLKLLRGANKLIYGGDTDVDRLFRKCDSHKTIKMKFHIQSDELQTNIEYQFARAVRMDTKLYTTSKSVTLELAKDKAFLQDAARTVLRSFYNPWPLCKDLLDNYFMPLIRKPVSVHLDTESNLRYTVLTLSYALDDVPVDNSLRPLYAQVLPHLKTLIGLLAEMNTTTQEDTHVLSIIGGHIRDSVLVPLVDEVLMKAIPQTFEEIEKSTLLADVIEFTDMLTEVHFIDSATDGVLGKFKENYDVYCRTGLFKCVLDAARLLIQKDLQDMTLIGKRHASNDVLKDQLAIPRCCISKSTLEYAKLVDSIISQSKTAREAGGNNYMQDLVPLLLETYMTDIPLMHKRLLERIPQQSALYYNNCMYLSNWIAEHPDVILPGVVTALKEESRGCFDEQVEQQRKVLCEILANIGLNNPSTPHILGSGPLKVIRQCMRQLELLCNVWLNVLPDDIYAQSFGYIVDEFIEKFIAAVVAMEDIPTTINNELCDIIDEILTKIPTFFRQSTDVHEALLWTKLEQLKFVLSGSLKDILDQWKDSNNSLSSNFTSDEMKRLVRAAFQNTNRRARVLMAVDL